MIRLWANAFLLTCCNTCLLWGFFLLQEPDTSCWRSMEHAWNNCRRISRRGQNVCGTLADSSKENVTKDNLCVDSDSEQECSSVRGMQRSLTYLYTLECLVTTHRCQHKVIDLSLFHFKSLLHHCPLASFKASDEYVLFKTPRTINHR